MPIEHTSQGSSLRERPNQPRVRMWLGFSLHHVAKIWGKPENGNANRQDRKNQLSINAEYHTGILLYLATRTNDPTMLCYCYMATQQPIGLVLSGGGTRGIAHIGAWSVLESMGFHPAAIAGCSMGAVIGAMIASGRTADEMEAFILAQRAMSFFQWPISKLGISTLTKFEKRLMDFIGCTRFEELEIPLVMNATNLTTGKQVIYNKGLLWPALRATISVPGLFAPVRTNGDVIVDGGILHEHPFTLLPLAIKQFIMVNCSPREALAKPVVSVIDVFRASLNIMQNTITEFELAKISSDRYLLIQPKVHGRNILEREKQFQQLVNLGKDAARSDRGAVRDFLQG